jgi:hypothetical protein
LQLDYWKCQCCSCMIFFSDQKTVSCECMSTYYAYDGPPQLSAYLYSDPSLFVWLCLIGIAVVANEFRTVCIREGTINRCNLNHAKSRWSCPRNLRCRCHFWLWSSKLLLGISLNLFALLDRLDLIPIAIVWLNKPMQTEKQDSLEYWNWINCEIFHSTKGKDVRGDLVLPICLMRVADEIRSQWMDTIYSCKP